MAMRVGNCVQSFSHDSTWYKRERKKRQTKRGRKKRKEGNEGGQKRRMERRASCDVSTRSADRSASHTLKIQKEKKRRRNIAYAWVHATDTVKERSQECHRAQTATSRKLHRASYTKSATSSKLHQISYIKQATSHKLHRAQATRHRASSPATPEHSIRPTQHARSKQLTRSRRKSRISSDSEVGFEPASMDSASTSSAARCPRTRVRGSWYIVYVGR